MKKNNAKGKKSKVCRSKKLHKTLHQDDKSSTVNGYKCVADKEHKFKNASSKTQQTSELAHNSNGSTIANSLHKENVEGNFVEDAVSPCDNVRKRHKKKKYYVFNIVVNTTSKSASPPLLDNASLESNETETRPLNLSEETITNIANEVVRNLSTLKKCFKKSSRADSQVSQFTSTNTISSSVCATVKGKEKSSLSFVENAKESLPISPLNVISASLFCANSEYEIGEITNGEVEWARNCSNCNVYLDTDEKLKTHNCLLCVGCKQYFQTATKLKTHQTSCGSIIKHVKPIPWCSTCNLQFKSESKLDEHVKGCNVCKICRKVVSRGFSKHMAAHEKKHLKCIKCITVPFASKQELDDHKVNCKGRKHLLNRTIICEVCGKVVPRRQFRKHKDGHENLKRFKCPFCDKSFNSTNTRSAHKKKVHRKSYLQYICSYCGLKSQSKSHIMEHEEIHKVPEGAPVSTPYACECGKAFVAKYELNRHRNQIHVQRKCSVCGEEFNGSIQLHRHFNITHKPKKQCRKCVAETKTNGVQPATCEHRKNAEYCHLCGHIFPTVNFKLRHMRRYHDDRSYKLEVVDHTGSRKIVEKIGDVFICDICGKQFALSNSFKEHLLLVHRPGRRFGCQLCQSRFKRKGDLTRHVKDSHGKPATNNEAQLLV